MRVILALDGQIQKETPCKKINAKDGYKKLIALAKKYKDVCIIDPPDHLEYIAKNHLFGLELVEKYGLNLDPKKINTSWNNISEYLYIGFYDGEKARISWSDNDEQPDNEYLLSISFPTGAYIFGSSSNDDYPSEFFQKFFNELRSYGPKFLDSVNHNLYYSLDNAKDVFSNFNSILKKYYELNKVDFNKRKAKKLREEAEKLELAN